MVTDITIQAPVYVKQHYTPPIVPGFTPHFETAPFTTGIRAKLETLNKPDTIIHHLDGVLYRTRIDNLTSDTDRTFAMTTSGDPSFAITYTVPVTSTAIDMFKLDGGFF